MIYFIQATVSKFIKIGFTDGDPQERLAALQTGCPEKLELLISVDGDRDLEQWLHQTFARLRHNGEWFAPDDTLSAFVAGAQIGRRSIQTPGKEITQSRIFDLLDKIDNLAKRKLVGASLLQDLAKGATDHDGKGWLNCHGKCGAMYCLKAIPLLVQFRDKTLPDRVWTENAYCSRFDVRVIDACRKIVAALEEANR